MLEVRRFVMMSMLVLLVGCGGASAPRGNPQQITDAGPPIDAGTPTAEGWTPLRQVPDGVGEAAIAAADGKIYLIGGYDTLPLLQIYDIAANSWSQGPALVAGTDNAGALATNGKVYVFGGEASPRVQIYDVAQRQWSTGPNLPSPRFSSVVEQIADQVHLVGGWSFSRTNNVSLASHTVFDLAGGSYLAGPFAPMQTARNHAYSGVIDGKLYVTGGRAPGHESDDGDNLSSTEVYDPATDAWSSLPALPTPRSGWSERGARRKAVRARGRSAGNDRSQDHRALHAPDRDLGTAPRHAHRADRAPRHRRRPGHLRGWRFRHPERAPAGLRGGQVPLAIQPPLSPDGDRVPPGLDGTQCCSEVR